MHPEKPPEMVQYIMSNQIWLTERILARKTDDANSVWTLGKNNLKMCWKKSKKYLKTNKWPFKYVYEKEKRKQTNPPTHTKPTKQQMPTQAIVMVLHYRLDMSLSPLCSCFYIYLYIHTWRDNGTNVTQKLNHVCLTAATL